MATATKTTKSVAKKTPAKKAASATKPEAKVAAETAKKPSGKYILATGRRKTAIANVRLFKGSQDSLVNRKQFVEYFSEKAQQDKALRPLALTGLVGEYYFTAHVSGGGRSSQVEAVRHGIAQALAETDNDLRGVLKKNGFLTRDDRKKERKKPGLKGARRRPQWAKR